MKKRTPKALRVSLKQRLKQITLEKYLFYGVLLSLAVPAVYVTVQMILSAVLPQDDPGDRGVGDYLLMLIECLLGLVVIWLPNLLEKRFRIRTPPRLYILYLIFLYCAIFLGEVANFYFLVPFWDVILHFLSSMMLSALGFSLVTILNQNRSVALKLSPLFLSLFSFCFAVCIGTIWEIYEFTVDTVLDINMQKYATADGTLMVGRAALQDTMEDILIDVTGALTIAVIGYVCNRIDAGWFDKWSVRIKEKDEPAPAAAVDAVAAAPVETEPEPLAASVASGEPPQS